MGNHTQFSQFVLKSFFQHQMATPTVPTKGWCMYQPLIFDCFAPQPFYSSESRGQKIAGPARCRRLGLHLTFLGFGTWRRGGDHPKTCRCLVYSHGVHKSPNDRVGAPLPNGLNCKRGVVKTRGGSCMSFLEGNKRNNGWRMFVIRMEPWNPPKLCPWVSISIEKLWNLWPLVLT